MSTVKGIGSFGSTALLVSSMTGPGLSTIPALFQQSGWAAPVFIFIVVAFLSGCSALFVCEALSNIRGNEKFQAKVELTTIAQVYLGTKYHYFFQLMLFLSLQSVNIASIIIAAQTFDSMLITVFKGTCGLGVYPGGWFCVTESAGIDGNSPFPTDDYFIFTFGFLLTAVLVIPLGFFSLVENIAVQMTSFVVLAGILIQWTVAFAQEGLDTSLLPASGSNSTMVLGIVIFNYSFITTIPSWVNSLKPDVNIHRCMWVSVIISTIFYLLLGICGAMAYQMDASSDILAILSAHGSTASKVTAYLFPVCALITSIPVFTIVIRSNLLRGEICSPSWAIFWSNLFPWIICIPLQTKDWVNTIQNWSSLFFQSTCNFILPFVLYFVSRKYIASVEPINVETDEKQTHQHDKYSIVHPPLAAPSPILQNPDDNDVRMFNPDDNYSISIRRSSIRPSKHSQMEVAASSAYSPVMDKGGLPTIVYSSDIASAAPSESMYRRSPSNGLGISHPPSDASTKLAFPASAPASPNLAKPENNNSRTSAPSTPRMDKLTVPMNPSSPRSPEITAAGAPITPQSPIRPVHSHHSSMLASVFSFRSSAIAPNDDLDEDKKQEVQEEHVELDRFIAFESKKWLNPFYLAIIACAALSISILFMIIYDLTLLGLGTDVFG
ncbi:conserved hypothetical protein [Mucor ambiguus]|uniref:Amino acid transporter transmembrane domain-containing protein n=1 Tax=Mucor ambiguus TaxID=91626 RepID=A0A0C9N8Z3_9FUNG|nr:conserved hypothetical protein [Mucor ambiguus]